MTASRLFANENRSHIMEPALKQTPPEPPAPTVDSAALLKGRRELQIRHGADTYRLRLTASNKLILTK